MTAVPAVPPDASTASIRASEDAAITGALRADFIVFAQGPSFTPAVADALRSDPKLKEVSELRASAILIGSSSQTMVAIDPVAENTTLSFESTSGNAAAIAADNTAIVDAVEASAHRLHAGDHVTITFPTGPVDFVPVGADGKPLPPPPAAKPK